MKTKIFIAVALFIELGTMCYGLSVNKQEVEVHKHEQKSNNVNLNEFSLVRDSLYDYAYTIAKRVVIDNDSEYLYDIDPETVRVLKTYQVPSLEYLLSALDQIDDHGDLADIYDDDEGTLWKYDRKRAEYESYFK